MTTTTPATTPAASAASEPSDLELIRQSSRELARRFDLVVLLGLCAAGWLLSGVNGTTAGAVMWLGGIGAAARAMARRRRSRSG